MQSPSVRFHDGNSIPQMGFGTGFTPGEDAPALIRTAIEIGYRHFDTAWVYQTENQVGEGVRTAGVPREEIFVTSKLWESYQGYEATLKECKRALKDMGLEYLDLYLIHWPVPEADLYVDTWRAMQRLRDDGLIRSIGVSNFAPEFLDRLKDETGEMPVINQIELNPRFQQRDMRAEHAKRGVVTEAWGPLCHGLNLSDPVFDRLATKHGRSPIQIALRWHMQSGIVAIPRAEKVEWMRANLAIFDFALDDEDMALIQTLDDPNGRGGPTPYHTAAERQAILMAGLAKLKAAAEAAAT